MNVAQIYPITTDANVKMANGKTLLENVGSSNGIAELDAKGTVPPEQLPVLAEVQNEDTLVIFPESGENQSGGGGGEGSPIMHTFYYTEDTELSNGGTMIYDTDLNAVFPYAAGQLYTIINKADYTVELCYEYIQASYFSEEVCLIAPGEYITLLATGQQAGEYYGYININNYFQHPRVIAHKAGDFAEDYGYYETGDVVLIYNPTENSITYGDYGADLEPDFGTIEPLSARLFYRNGGGWTEIPFGSSGSGSSLPNGCISDHLNYVTDSNTNIYYATADDAISQIELDLQLQDDDLFIVTNEGDTDVYGPLLLLQAGESRILRYGYSYENPKYMEFTQIYPDFNGETFDSMSPVYSQKTLEKNRYKALMGWWNFPIDNVRFCDSIYDMENPASGTVNAGDLAVVGGAMYQYNAGLQEWELFKFPNVVMTGNATDLEGLYDYNITCSDGNTLDLNLSNLSNEISSLLDLSNEISSLLDLSDKILVSDSDDGYLVQVNSSGQLISSSTTMSDIESRIYDTISLSDISPSSVRYLGSTSTSLEDFISDVAIYDDYASSWRIPVSSVKLPATRDYSWQNTLWDAICNSVYARYNVCDTVPDAVVLDQSTSGSVTVQACIETIGKFIQNYQDEAYSLFDSSTNTLTLLNGMTKLLGSIDSLNISNSIPIMYAEALISFVASASFDISLPTGGTYANARTTSLSCNLGSSYILKIKACKSPSSETFINVFSLNELFFT